MRIRWHFFLLIVLIGLMPSLHAFQILGYAQTDPALVSAISNNTIGVVANKSGLTYLQQTTRKYDHRSVALSSALASLPTDGGAGAHACGVGAGVRGNYSAMAIGCAADIASFKLFDKLPSFIRNADVNLGTSFLNHDDPDYTFKAGLTWSFGGAKSIRNEVAAKYREDATAIVIEHKNALAIKTLQRDNQALQRDNKILKESNAALNRKLNVLIAGNQRFLDLSEKMERLAQQIETQDALLAIK